MFSALPHCSAIAFAIPRNVLLLILLLSTPGGSFHTDCLVGVTMLVGTNLGRLYVQRHVALLSGSPNCQG